MQEFEKKKSQKPTGNGSGNSFDDIESIQLDQSATDALLDEIDTLLNACSKPIIDKIKDEEEQNLTNNSGQCGCF